MNYHEREAINKMDDMLTDKTEEEDYTFLQVTSWVLSKFSTGLKVGRMTRTIWVTWVTFLVGQVGLIHKLNYLDVTRIFNRSHVH